jgi:hypothetical protein
MVRILAFGGLVIALMLGCIENHGRERVSDRGTVRFIGLEGGFYGIIDDHARHWDPTNLPEKFKTDSLRVRFEAVITDEPSFHMWGRVVDLISIEPLELPERAAQ